MGPSNCRWTFESREQQCGLGVRIGMRSYLDGWNQAGYKPSVNTSRGLDFHENAVEIKPDFKICKTFCLSSYYHLSNNTWEPFNLYEGRKTLR